MAAVGSIHLIILASLAVSHEFEGHGPYEHVAVGPSRAVALLATHAQKAHASAEQYATWSEFPVRPQRKHP